MTWKELPISKFNSIASKVVVDVRAPIEFEKERIPGSVNVPLLENDEREKVGIIYKQEGEFRARQEALDIVACKIPRIVQSIVDLKQPNHTLVVNCWRGGMRSEAVVSFLSLMGVDCWRLQGGYKAFRRSVLDRFEKDDYKFKVVVLNGLTGVGKTDVLAELEKLEFGILDLERFANHRGSVFGGLGMGSQPSQKDFDSLIWQELNQKHDDFLFVEAESRKIGNVTVPTFLLERIKNGPRIILEADLEARVSRIERDYPLYENRESIVKLLDTAVTFKERLGSKKVKQLSDLLLNGEVSQFIENILIDYYDPLYKRHIDNSPSQYSVSANNPAEAACKIKEWVGSHRAVLSG